MFCRRSATIKYFVAASLGAALYCEWFVYLLQPIYWDELACDAQDPSCTKILFVADPQIQGDEAVPTPFNYLFNWDSDKYLKSTFSVVSNKFNPDVIVYLGDLMDEGSISSIAQFHQYVKRLSNIFDVHYPVTQVWVPGDNDIGGENEPIRRNKVAEFEKIFKQPSIVTFRNVSFFKVNGITHTFPRAGHVNGFKIVVSHYPITVRHSFGEVVNNALRPNIYFCAHEHESKYVKQNMQLTFRETYPYKAGDNILDISFNGEDLFEIYVPTCSYRMGTSKIGYGAAILENDNRRMRYTVFWSSQRFPFLFFYLGLLVTTIVYIVIFCAAKVIYRHSKHVSKSDEKVPFLDRI